MFTNTCWVIYVCKHDVIAISKQWYNWPHKPHALMKSILGASHGGLSGYKIGLDQNDMLQSSCIPPNYYEIIA